MNQKFESKEACECILTAALLWEVLAGLYATHEALSKKLRRLFGSARRVCQHRYWSVLHAGLIQLTVLTHIVTLLKEY